MPYKEEIDDDIDAESVDSESSNESIFNETSVACQLKDLQTGIERRQLLLSKLLHDKEGTGFAKNLLHNEDRVNTFLLSRLGEQLHPSDDFKPSVKTSRPSSSMEDENTERIETIMIEFIKKCITFEVQYTLPGLISLITHCSLYLSIHGCLNIFLEYLCDRGIVYLFGWHIRENAFDCTKHEQMFYVIYLIFGCIVARITGSIWAWNDNELFQRRLKAELKSRKSRRDGKWIRCFEVRGKSKRKWGSRWKLFMDSFTFFVVYIAVDKLLLKDFVYYVLDTRASVLQGMPSRSLDNHGARIDQCSNLDSINNSISAEECPNTCAQNVEYVSDIVNWLEYKNRCRWVEKEQLSDDEVDGDKFRPWYQHIEKWKQIINDKDEEYLLENISYKTYYELVGDPSSHFIDPYLENVFYMTLTAGGFGVLWVLDAPFLLI